MPSTASCLSSPCGQRAVASEHRRAHERPLPAGLLARGGELARVADRFEVLLRDLEQHAAEVVGDERGDGGQQRAERLDQPLGLLVVGRGRCVWIGRRTCSSNISTASVGDRARRVVVTASRARAGRGAGSRLRAAAARRAARRRRPRCSRSRRRAAAATISPSRATASSSGAGHADARGELVEREQLGVAGLRAGHRGRERARRRRRARRRAAGGSPPARSPGAGGP